jgi:hypothetical protein
MGLAGSGLAEAHRAHGLVNVGDGHHIGARIGESIKGIVGRDPEFAGHSKDRPGHDPLAVAVGVAPIHRDGVHLCEAGPIIGAPINRHAVAVNPIAWGDCVKGRGARPVRSDIGPAGKTGTGRPGTP